MKFLIEIDKAHVLTAYTGKWVEDISNSYPTFINVLQPVTFGLE